jgi:amino acid permease
MYTCVYVLQALFLGLSLAIGLTVDDLGVLLSLVGATGSTIVSFILPGFLYYLMFKDKGPAWKVNLALAQGILGVFIVPICLTLIFL